METRRRKRAAWGSITRDLVIDAAERAVRAGQYDEMTIRSIAAELDVAPMSLYRHVQDKDDLLDEVVDRLLARRWRPRASTDEWMVWIIEAAQRLRSFLVAQPAALYVYLKHPVVSPAALARMEAMLGVLSNAGFDEDSAQRAYGTIHTYTIGFAALEASRARSESSRNLVDQNAKLLASFTTTTQFNEGLALLIDGIERRRMAAR